MKPLTTLVLFLISVALGFAIWWTGRRPVSASAEPGGSGKALVRFVAEDLGKIVVKRPAGEVVLENRDGFWHFNQPIADRADPDSMKAFLDQLSHLTVLDRVPMDEVGSRDELSPEALGLDAAGVVRVELHPKESKGSPPVSILLGNAATLTNSTYARLPESTDRPDVYLVQGQPRTFLDDPVTALRDRHLFLAPADQIVQVTVRTAKEEVEMKRRMANPPTGWTQTKPMLTRADDERVEALLASLSALRAESVEPAKNPAFAAPKPVPDGAAVLELWRYGVEAPLTLYLKPAPDGEAGEKWVEAAVSDREGSVFRAKSDVLASLATVATGFRDPRLIRLAPNAVFGIAIDSRGNPPVVLRTARSQEGVKWFSERNGESEPANEAQIASLLQTLNTEKALGFVSDSADRLAEFNLADPAMTIELSHYEMLPETAPDGAAAGGGGKLGIAKKVLRFGYVDSGDGTEDSFKLFANVVGEPFILRVNPAFREKAPTHPLKWKDLRVLSFNPISLRGVERQSRVQAASNLKLAYDWRRDEWEGGQVNKEAIRKLRERLGSLAATRWLTPSPQAFQALETPEAEFRVTLETVDRATGKPGETVVVLKFARASEVSYYGRKDESPDLFEIDRETYRDMIAPVLAQPVEPPK
jgi:hypothetical protein